MFEDKNYETDDGKMKNTDGMQEDTAAESVDKTPEGNTDAEHMESQKEDSTYRMTFKKGEAESETQQQQQQQQQTYRQSNGQQNQQQYGQQNQQQYGQQNQQQYRQQNQQQYGQQNQQYSQQNQQYGQQQYGQQNQQYRQQNQQQYGQQQYGQQNQQYRQQTQQQYGQQNQQQYGQQNQQYRQQNQQQYNQQQYAYNSQGNQAGGGRGSRRQSRAAAAGQRFRRPFLTAIGCAVICGVIIAACVVGSFAIGRNMTAQTATNVTISTNEDKLTSSSGSGTTVEAESTSTSGDYTVAQIAEQCGSSVVAITNRSVQEVLTMFGYYEYESEGSGSGVIIGLDDDELLIVTNYHVVEDADELTVCFFDSEEAVYSAAVKGTDPNNDLAVVAIPVSDIHTEVLEAISIATIGDSDAMQVGDEVVAIGNALGLGQSVTSGIISALDREVTIDSYTARLIQTDAAINPGNSGGALFNMKGELIGINSAKYASEEVEGMGFAIPMSTAQPIIESLMSLETRTKLTENYGCLNITGTNVTSDAYQSYGMPQGVYIASVLEGGAAANAGMQTGDIITSMDGIAVTSIETMKDRLQYYAAGESVDFTIARNSGNGYEEMDVTVILDNASEQDASAFESSEEDDTNSYGYDEDFYNYFYGDGGNSYDGGSGYYFGY